MADRDGTRHRSSPRRRRHVHECSDEDFEDLCEQASSLKSSPDEARRLLLDCARAGGSIENDSILALLRTFGDDDDDDDRRGETSSNDGDGTTSTSFVDTVDGGGNTALHRACANGHDVTASILIEDGGASFLRNRSGNTPLHWAAGAGHVGCVRVLLENFPSSQDSKDGISGGSFGVIDVLEKNDFGRSALTEGFASQNTEVVGMLLEHDSATEERLIGGGNSNGGGGVSKKDEVVVDDDDAEVADVSDDDDSKEEEKQQQQQEEGGEEASGNSKMGDAARRQYEEAARGGVVHEFDFRRTGSTDGDDDANFDEHENKPGEPCSSIVLIRELPIANADDPFGSGGDAAGDTTGFGIWAASLVLARWVSSDEMSSRFDGRTVLELGAGCGVPGIAAARYSNASAVYVTDLNPATVENLRHNVELNAGGKDDHDAECGRLPWRERVKALPIDWADESTWPTSSSGERKMDFVIGSDLIYQADVVPLVRRVVRGLLKEDGGVFLYVAPNDGHRDGSADFIKEMKEEMGVSFFETVAPDEYLVNPLRSGDEDDCFLHFHELGSTSYMLYEFRRCAHRWRG